MNNTHIIDEFKKLLIFIKIETDNFIKNNETKKVTANTFRIKQIQNIINILKKYPKKISLKNYLELKEISGIGINTIQRIKEILENGELNELKNFTINIDKNKEKSLNILASIIGIGNTTAKLYYDQGITSIDILKKKIKSGELKVSDQIKLGLKYHNIYKTNIPRNEIDDFYKIIKKIIDKMNKSLHKNEHYIFDICGSYRRQKEKSNDIDVLVSKLDITKTSEINYLNLLITELKKKKLLVDDITNKDYKTKYMGFIKYLNNPVRRIDIRFVPYTSYYSALLYFTGSAELNKQMRQTAKNKKLKLSEYGLFNENNVQLVIKSEKDIFKYLNIEFIEPKFR